MQDPTIGAPDDADRFDRGAGEQRRERAAKLADRPSIVGGRRGAHAAPVVAIAAGVQAGGNGREVAAFGLETGRRLLQPGRRPLPASARDGGAQRREGVVGEAGHRLDPMIALDPDDVARHSRARARGAPSEQPERDGQQHRQRDAARARGIGGPATPGGKPVSRPREPATRHHRRPPRSPKNLAGSNSQNASSCPRQRQASSRAPGGHAAGYGVDSSQGAAGSTGSGGKSISRAAALRPSSITMTRNRRRPKGATVERPNTGRGRPCRCIRPRSLGGAPGTGWTSAASTNSHASPTGNRRPKSPSTTPNRPGAGS